MVCVCVIVLSVVYSAEGKPLSKKALKKQQKDAEKAKRKAETAAKLVGCSEIRRCTRTYVS